MSETVIELKGIGKRYSVNFTKQSLVGSFLSFLRRTKVKTDIWALSDVSFSIAKGQTVGIIGENASGKTTILRVISGITIPTQGVVDVKGKVAGLLDLSAGFHPELTGRENIYIDAALYGLNREETDAVYEKIVAFSGLEDFINAQVKTYSQGMLVRLGFSVAVHIEPDIFLIDDSLAVGDEEFQRKCLRKISELKQLGKTIVIVSHDLDSLSRICERALLLKDGHLIKDDLAHKTVVRYIEAVGDKASIACVDRGKLSVIFNNGKMVMLWDGKPLTKNFGGYVSLEALDKWIMSWGAQWRVVESCDHAWKVEGVLHKYDTRFMLECAVSDENSLTLRVQIKFPRSVGIKKASVGFMLVEKYNYFLSEDSVERIQVQENIKQRWLDIFRTDEHNPSLVLISEEDMPVVRVSFDQNKYAGFGLIQTTDWELDARIMQMQLILPKDIRLQDTDVNIVECTAKINLLNEQAFDIFIQKRQEKNIINSGALRLQLKNRSIHLFYDNEELSKYKNMMFGFFCGGYYFDIFNGKWQLQKDAADSLSLYSEFKDLKLKLTLILRLENECVKWSMGIEGDKSPEVETLFAQLFLTEGYDKYFDALKEEKFFAPSEHNEQIKLSNPQSDFIGLCTEKHDLPAIVFEAGQNSNLELQNASFDIKGRVIACQTSKSNSAIGTIMLLDTLAKKNDFVIQKQKAMMMNTVLSGDRVQLEFRQDRISIYQDNVEITADEGFCSGIYFEGRWHESKQLTKKFSKEGDTLKVLIKRQIPSVNEFWNINLKGTAIHWSVVLESSESLAGLSCKAGIILNSNFKQWVHSFSEGEFSEGKNLDKVVDLDDANNTLLGAKTIDTALPVLFFEKIDAIDPAGIIIQKTDNRHFLQFKFKGGKEINDENKQKVFAGNIRLCGQADWEENISEYRLSKFSLLTKNKLQLFATSGKIRLLFNDRELTKKDGLRVSLITDQGEIDTYYASWALEKISQNKIVAQLSWDNFSLQQWWYFELKNDAIEWTVVLNLKQRLALKELVVNMFVGFFFDHWLTRKQKGKIDFSKADNRYITIFDKRSDFIGVCEGEIPSANPALVLNPLVNMQEWFLHICKYHREKVTICGGHCILNPHDKYLAAGRHEIFKGRMFLLDNEKELSNLIVSSGLGVTDELCSGRLKLSIEKAGINLFWQGKELTKTLGFYTAFFNQGNWVDSTLACWQTKILSDQAEICLYWNKLFVFQKWKIRIVNEHEIFWQIDTDIHEAKTTSITAALMLNNTYDCYEAVGDKQGKFPSQFQDDYWLQLALTDKLVRVKVSDQHFPDIVFKGSVEGHDYINVIENSDNLHSARVLKCESNISSSDSEEGHHISFKVKIVLDE